MPNPHAIDVSILVVSYNTKDLTLAALDSIAAETKDVSYEVIVVDNNSHDGSTGALADHPVVSHFIALDENIGFARANNLASEKAKGRYILLLNSDTVVLDGAIDTLVKFADQNKRALIWGGRTVFADGSLNPSSVWRHFTPWTLLCRITGLTAIFPKSEIFNREVFGNWQRDSERHVDIVSGCFFLMPTSVWRALGGFDPTFFMYGEEADLCRRAQRIGAQPLMTPKAQIIHYGGASEATRSDKMVKLLSGLATLISRHWPYPLDTLGQKMLLAWPLTRWLALSGAARVSGKAGFSDKAKVWKEIFDARAIWQFGYARKQPCLEEQQAAPSLTNEGRDMPSQTNKRAVLNEVSL